MKLSTFSGVMRMLTMRTKFISGLRWVDPALTLRRAPRSLPVARLTWVWETVKMGFHIQAAGAPDENHRRAVRATVPARQGRGRAARPQVQGPGGGGSAARAADAAWQALQP